VAGAVAADIRTGTPVERSVPDSRQLAVDRSLRYWVNGKTLKLTQRIRPHTCVVRINELPVRRSVGDGWNFCGAVDRESA
jgi:hypothetical protein